MKVATALSTTATVVALSVPMAASANSPERPVFVVPAGGVVALASECYANDPHVRTLGGRPFHFTWNADHDRLVYRLHPHGARVVFDGVAFHNHTHHAVRVAVRCGR
jgi:hypothetical protein